MLLTDFEELWKNMEKNSIENQPIRTELKIQFFSKTSPIFRSLHFKNYRELDKTINRKVIALAFMNKFYIDKSLSVVQDSSE